jgi:hypothetical protein
LEASRARVKNSLGYHWKAKANPEPIKEFATLARFKTVEFGIGKFLLVALLLGAAGNALWDGAKELYSRLGPTQAQVTGIVDNRVQSVQANPIPDVSGTTSNAVGQTGTRKENK